jgi:hypothetical protein
MKELLKYLLIIIILVPLPYACGLTGNDRYAYFIKSLENEIGELQDTSGNDVLKTTDLPDTLNAEKFGIMVYIDELYQVPTTSSGAPILWMYLLADPAPLIIQSKIDLISIYPTDSIYTDIKAYAADESVIELFELSDFFSPDDKTSVLTFIDEMDSWHIEEAILFQSSSNLARPYKGTFNMKFTMDNGDEIWTETKEVILE